MNSVNSAEGTAWVLEELYKGDDDPKLEQDLKSAYEKALRFVRSFKGKLRSKETEAGTFLNAIKEYEVIHEIGLKPYLFAYLRRASDRKDLNQKRKFQNVQEAWSEIIQLMTFFRLEIMELPEPFLRGLVGRTDLSAYSHFLLDLSEWKPYSLSEPEERIIEKKNLAGKKALLSLYDEFVASLSFRVVIDRKAKEVGISQLLAFLSSPIRSLRERSLETLLKKLGSHGMVFRDILNALIFDKYLEDIERGHPFPMHRSLLSNEVRKGTVEAMLWTVGDHYPLARKYFRLKARLLELRKLKISDMFGPLKGGSIEIRFSEARQIILEALKNVHPVYYSEACGLFENRRIDAEVRKEKQFGAFCKCLAPCQHPYISLNYSGSIRDLMTLAHEIGHGIHYRLASTQKYLNFNPKPVLAETASAFTEILVIQHLIEKEEFQDHRPAILERHLAGIITGIFRQNVITRFEESLHNSGEARPLSNEKICQLWCENNQKFYGEDVEMTPDYQWAWTYIPHVFHRPFYCYSYIFGYLLSIILFQNYMHMGTDFVEKIIDLFSSGSSRRPIDVLEGLGMDPGKGSFWEQSFKYIDEMIDALDRV